MSAIFGEVLRFAQAKGPEIYLKVFGDEHYARYEDLSGYSAVYDDQLGLFCYARLSVGSFRSTGTPLSQPVPEGLVRHLQESQETIVGAGGRQQDAPRRDGRRHRRGRGGADLRAQPGPARRPRAVDRRGEGPHDPGQLQRSREHRHAR